METFVDEKMTKSDGLEKSEAKMKNSYKLPVKDKDVVGSINSFLHDILEKKLVHALLIPQEVPSGDNLVQTLISDLETLKRANPLSPVMGVHSSKIVSRMTKRMPSWLAT